MKSQEANNTNWLKNDADIIIYFRYVGISILILASFHFYDFFSLLLLTHLFHNYKVK